jgi:hypothetical protein
MTELKINDRESHNSKITNVTDISGADKLLQDMEFPQNQHLNVSDSAIDLESNRAAITLENNIELPAAKLTVEEATKIMQRANLIQDQIDRKNEEAALKNRATNLQKYFGEDGDKKDISIASIVEHSKSLGVSEEAVLQAFTEHSRGERWETKRRELAKELGLNENASPQQIAVENKLREFVDSIKLQIEGHLNEIMENPIDYQSKTKFIETNCHLTYEESQIAFKHELNSNFLYYAVPVVGQVIFFSDLCNDLKIVPLTSPRSDKVVSLALLELQEYAKSIGGKFSLLFNSKLYGQTSTQWNFPKGEEVELMIYLSI